MDRQFAEERLAEERLADRRLTDRRLALVGALVALLAGGPAPAAEDTLSGTLVSVDEDGREFTIESSEGKRHVFASPPAVDMKEIEPGTDVQVTAEPITDVEPDERRQASAVAVLPAEPEGEDEPAGGGIPSDPSTGAPGGGPPSGGVPGGGVPSGGVPSGSVPSGAAPIRGLP